MKNISRLIAAFLCLFSATAFAELHIEAGPTYLSGEYSGGAAVLIGERTENWDFGFGWTPEQWVLPSWEEDRGLPIVHLRSNLFIHATRIIPIKMFELGIGVAYFSQTSRAMGQQLNLSAAIRWNISDQLSFGIRHFSNGGAGTPNLGQDMLTVGYTF